MARSSLLKLALGVLAIALALGLFRARQGSASQPGAGDGRPAAAAKPVKKPAPKPAQVAAPAPEAETPASDLPRSLEGTEVDGQLAAGPDGHLVLGPRVIELFDYFFSASGEESDSAIIARIQAYARAHLTEPALGEALALLGKYTAYREAGRTLRIQNEADAAERFAAIKKLRREHFGADADALFGDEEKLAEVAIAKSQAGRDPEESPEDRKDRLATADKYLPASARAARERATAVLDLRADEAALREGGADEDAVHRYRESKFGAEAADRMAALDRERAAFKARIEAFRLERDRQCSKLKDPVTCESDLLERSFDERERIRVRTILSMPAN